MSRRIGEMLILAVLVISCIVCSTTQAREEDASSSVALPELDAIARYRCMPSIFIGSLEGNFGDFFRKITVPGKVVTISTSRPEILERSLNVFGGSLANPEDKEMKKFLAAYFVPKISLQGSSNYQNLLIGSMRVWGYEEHEMPAMW